MATPTDRQRDTVDEWFEHSELAHYGVKGMKWGVRKPGTGKPSKRSARAANEQKRKAEIKSMSDTELRNRINRIKMERELDQLTKPETSKGKKMVQDLLLNTAKQQLTQAASKAAAKSVEEAMKAIK